MTGRKGAARLVDCLYLRSATQRVHSRCGSLKSLWNFAQFVCAVAFNHHHLRCRRRGHSTIRIEQRRTRNNVARVYLGVVDARAQVLPHDNFVELSREDRSSEQRKPVRGMPAFVRTCVRAPERCGRTRYADLCCLSTIVRLIEVNEGDARQRATPQPLRINRDIVGTPPLWCCEFWGSSLDRAQCNDGHLNVPLPVRCIMHA